MRILREILAGFVRDGFLVFADQHHPIFAVEIGVERIALAVLVGVEDVLEMMMLETKYDIRIHRDEAAIAVIGETLVAGEVRQRFHRLVVEAKVEHGIHHARHRRPCTGAHRHEQWVFCIAEAFAGDLADRLQGLIDLRFQLGGIRLFVGVEIGADRRRNRKTRRHRQAEIGHLGQVRSFAAQEIAQAGFALGLPVAEAVNPLAGFDGLDRRFHRLGSDFGNRRLCHRSFGWRFGNRGFGN